VEEDREGVEEADDSELTEDESEGDAPTPPRSPPASDDEDDDGGDDFGAGEGSATGERERTGGKNNRRPARRGARDAASARGRAAWTPSPEELAALAAGEPVDPDLPIVGDASMSIALDFAQIAGVHPTVSLLLPPAPRTGGDDDEEEPELPEGVLRPPSDAVPLLTATQPALREDASVRFFLRLTVNSSFGARGKRWLCREVVLFRESLYGYALPPPPPLPRMHRAPSEVSDGGSSAAPSGDGGSSGATSPKLTPSMPGRAREPSMSKIALSSNPSGGGDVSASGATVSANSSFSLGTSAAAAVGSAAAAVAALASTSPRKSAQTPPMRGNDGGADSGGEVLDADAVLDDIEGGQGTPVRGGLGTPVRQSPARGEAL
jgi:hypothetical protein